jgi:hypothetical protein
MQLLSHLPGFCHPSNLHVTKYTLFYPLNIDFGKKFSIVNVYYLETQSSLSKTVASESLSISSTCKQRQRKH